MKSYSSFPHFLLLWDAKVQDLYSHLQVTQMESVHFLHLLLLCDSIREGELFHYQPIYVVWQADTVWFAICERQITSYFVICKSKMKSKLQLASSFHFARYPHLYCSHGCCFVSSKVMRSCVLGSHKLHCVKWMYLQVKVHRIATVATECQATYYMTLLLGMCMAPSDRILIRFWILY